jgi:hypothetical protein
MSALGAGCSGASTSLEQSKRTREAQGIDGSGFWRACHSRVPIARATLSPRDNFCSSMVVLRACWLPVHTHKAHLTINKLLVDVAPMIQL